MKTSLYYVNLVYFQLSGSKLKRLVPFEGGTHNDTCLCAGFYEAIAQFLYEVDIFVHIDYTFLLYSLYCTDKIFKSLLEIKPEPLAPSQSSAK